MSDTPSTVETEIATEQQYVDRVYTRLDELRAEAVANEAAGYRQVDARTPGALVERDAFVYQAARRLRSLDSEYEGLVFGRLDLSEGRNRVRYVGRLGLRDEAMNTLLVDWRAPAAAPFYQATPEHRLSVIRRRVIRSSGPKVLGVEDDLLDPELGEGMTVIGDGALMAALTRARSAQMRDIVATIQAEQDKAVRAPGSGVTLITGGPGTGKTAVALHRAAYLLYSDRRRYEGGGVLVVGPSPVFMTYIERVLPSLGENAVTLRSLGDVVDGVQATQHDNPRTAALKGSLGIRSLLVRLVRQAPPGTPQELRLTYRGEVLRLDAATLKAARARVHERGILPNHGRNRAAAALIADLWRVYRDRLRNATVEERDSFVSDMKERNELLEFVTRWWPQLTPLDVLGWLRDPELVRRLGGPRGLTFAAEPSIQDIPLLDELRMLLGEPPKPKRTDPFHVIDGIRELTTAADREFASRQPIVRSENYDEYAHVVIDEAQDLSPMQWRMLGRRGKYASWTIVGDPAQASWEDAAEARKARDLATGRTKRHTFELTTNYRNSAEIFNEAAAIARRGWPGVRLPSAVRTTGLAPSHRVSANPREAVRAAAAELLDRLEGTIGVACTMSRRAEVAGWIEGLDPERLFAVGSLETKGLEYDGVVVLEPGDIATESPAGMRTLYVVLTRATQELITVATRPDWQELLN
ncbi:HelD family protein [Longispora albida]|uniref:HelD family protein n=1 Tax=Longispora albida TaxID=203523 RepID=UPI00037E9940|nr:UvrD-helicase domain-containing protein [Longispora albida]